VNSSALLSYIFLNVRVKYPFVLLLSLSFDFYLHCVLGALKILERDRSQKAEKNEM
jgi:hypothetical protein